MDTLLEQYREKAKAITDEEFNMARDSVLTNIAEKDKSMKEEFVRIYTGEMSCHRY